MLRRIYTDYDVSNLNIINLLRINWSPELRVMALSLLVTFMTSLIPVNASDLEIYEAAQAGSATVMMMLDTSISMSEQSIEEDYPAQNFNIWRSEASGLYFCNGYYQGDSYYGSNLLQKGMITEAIYQNDGTMTSETISFPVVYCEGDDGKNYYDRLSRLKMALIPLFANPNANFGRDKKGNDIDFTHYKIGFGEFKQHTDEDWGSGRLLVPALALNFINRKKLVNQLKALETYESVNTPTANAYAEVGAYMMGQRTSLSKRDTTVGSGFNFSLASTKVANEALYNSPIEPPVSGRDYCNGYGIYLLTDGEANSSTIDTAKALMNYGLGRFTTAGMDVCSSELNSDGAKYQGSFYKDPAWECIGGFARLLNSQNNPKKTTVLTAAVGLGRTFAALGQLDKIPKMVVNASGEHKIVPVSQCGGAGVGVDAKNLCKLGEKGEGYGEGGFFYAKEASEIAASIIKFITEVESSNVNPVSTGNISVPVDGLGSLQSRQFAYLPLLAPVPGQVALWRGNLKKYQVKNAILEGVNNKLVFNNIRSQFAINSIDLTKDTWDVWNTVKEAARRNPGVDKIPDDALKPDQGLLQVGGTYQQVFENPSKSRNLFVNSSGRLKNLTVNSSLIPNNFDSLTHYEGWQKRTLLRFMGYKLTATTAIIDGIALSATKDKWLKNIGGVMHSQPQLITTKVDIDGKGNFLTKTRQDYLLYGSMDGALHMVDDRTGKETFTFIPKQILTLQPDALVGSGTTINGSYPYGVDAPWLSYVAYGTKSVVSDTGAPTINHTFEADKSIVMGGLRMGGSMYYALDVTDVSHPTMIYSFGSNYANRLQNSALLTASGTINDVSGSSSSEHNAVKHMGQTWGKPAIGYVRSGGKRVMVSFLPGGYDTCYEDPYFKLNTENTALSECSNKPQAQGNALYMVQVGEEKRQANKESYIDAGSNNGKLLWWANNSGTGNDKTIPNVGLQYSKKAGLKHSIVTQVRVLDRNYDGLTDHLYFADLGGQVWRVDINNNDSANFKIDRVVKVLDVSDQASGLDAPPRFYERPLITFYHGRYDYQHSIGKVKTYTGVAAMVTVGTGDRSSPVAAARSTPNALYSIIDKDVSRQKLFDYGSEAQSITMRTPSIEVADLAQLTFTAADMDSLRSEGSTDKAGIQSKMQNDIAQGWYMPLTHWRYREGIKDAISSGKYKLKTFNEPDAIAGILLFSTYNPEAGSTVNNCSAGIKGETQRERICLPYGVCLDRHGVSAITPTRSVSIAGVGIMDNVITQYNDSSVFTSINRYCQGDGCKPELICEDDSCDTFIDPKCKGSTCEKFDTCYGPDCGNDASIKLAQRLSPLSWMEH